MHHPRIAVPTVNQCDMMDDDCETSFRTLTELSYCPEFHGQCADNNSRTECRYMDHLAAGVNTGDDNAMVATHIHMIWQKASEKCQPSARNGYSCNKTFRTDKTDHFYVADVENFWLILNHAIAEKETGIKMSVEKAAGTLVFNNGTEKLVPGPEESCSQKWWQFRPIPCPTPQLLDEKEGFTDTDGDHMKVNTLLAAAGLNLDEVRNRTNRTFRNDGVALRIDIEYYNTRPFNIFQSDQRVGYKYMIGVDRMTNYQIDEIRPSTHLKGGLSRERLQVRKKGIYFRFEVNGKLGFFSLNTLVLQFAGSMALLVLCDKIVRWLASQAFFVGELRAAAFEKEMYQIVGENSDFRGMGLFGRMERQVSEVDNRFLHA
eukprot:CAMPEP_0172843290 /NCGR_PEP_ID=MMETSP1075-20121228/31355_1 /TAXON_ID=2916 /ORGANISM="Ceratium fusus, Strain PA161109" /LENGTH=373 /DNA_ID=CAMNT_0013687537 /DNA_START=163 /DNA_END=1284 /DNA_ORIENTATION=-